MDKLSNPIARLKSIPAIAQMLDKAQELERINRELAVIIPEPYRSSLCIANIREQILILHAASSAWATRLRYMAPMILAHLQAHGWPHLISTEVRVSRNRIAAPVPSLPERPGLSATTIKLIQRIAQNTNDPQLRHAWESLAGGNFPAEE